MWLSGLCLPLQLPERLFPSTHVPLSNTQSHLSGRKFFPTTLVLRGQPPIPCVKAQRGPAVSPRRSWFPREGKIHLVGHCTQEACCRALGAASPALWPGLAGPDVSVLDTASQSAEGLVLESILFT